MLTGTPLDLTPFGVIFANISLIYWGFAFICLLVALIWPRKLRFRYRLISAVTVIVLFLINPVHDFLYNHPQRVANTLRSQAAAVYFKHRCDNDAGVKIYRTADNVDSILLMKVRPGVGNAISSDPFYPDAAFGGEIGGEGFISSFLSGEWMYTEERVGGNFGEKRKRLLNYPEERGVLRLPPRTREQMAEDRPGYKYVDVLEPASDPNQPPLRYRYVGYFENLWKKNPERYIENLTDFKLEKKLTNEPAPRYAVTYEDSLNPLDRLHWVAGSTVKVIDTRTDEVMATFTRYVFSPRLGRQGGASGPWEEANRRGLECPDLPEKKPRAFDYYKTRYFVDQVLRPAPWDADFILHQYQDDR